MKRFRLESCVALLSVFVLTIVAYAPSFRAPFVFDDSTHIERNPAIRMNSLKFGSLVRAAFYSPEPNRPVTNLSLALNYWMGRYDVRWYHATNMTIHILAGFLVFLVVRIILSRWFVSLPDGRGVRTVGIFPVALFSALLFVAHPVQVESVAYVIQRATALAGMFSLVTFFCYLRGRAAQGRVARLLFFSAAVAAWLLALGSKETAVTLPLCLLLFDWYFPGDLQSSWLRRKAWLLAALVIAGGAVALLYFHGRPVVWFSERYARASFTMWERVMTEFRVLVFYLSLLLFPHPQRLSLIHHFPISSSLHRPPTTVLSLLFVCALIGLAVCVARRERWVSFCILWYFLNLALESSILPLWIIFEHRLYLATFGFATLGALLLFRLLDARPSLATIILSAAVVLMAGASRARNEVWADPERLWRDVIAKNPESPVAHGNLGDIMLERGRLDEAGVCFENVLRYVPQDVMAHVRLGVVRQRQGRIAEAVGAYSRALELKSDDVAALNNLAWLYAVSSDVRWRNLQKAEALLAIAERVVARPNPELLDTQAAVLAATGDFSAAVAFAEEAYRLARKNGNEQLAAEIEARATLYRNRRPYLE